MKAKKRRPGVRVPRMARVGLVLAALVGGWWAAALWGKGRGDRPPPVTGPATRP